MSTVTGFEQGRSNHSGAAKLSSRTARRQRVTRRMTRASRKANRARKASSR